MYFYICILWVFTTAGIIMICNIRIWLIDFDTKFPKNLIKLFELLRSFGITWGIYIFRRENFFLLRNSSSNYVNSYVRFRITTTQGKIILKNKMFLIKIEKLYYDLSM